MKGYKMDKIEKVQKRNFKAETLFRLGTLFKANHCKIKEYYFVYTDYNFHDDTVEDSPNEYVYIYEGKKKINWNEIPIEQLEYDPNSGDKVWMGWISFSNGNWIERTSTTTFEIVKNRFLPIESESWEYREYPKLD